MEIVVKICVSIVLVILAISYAPQSLDDVPQIGSDRLGTIHRTLAISLSAQDFSNECTRLARKPPKWFVSRREMFKNHVTMTLVGKQIFAFNTSEPAVISRPREHNRSLKIDGDGWTSEISIAPESAIAFQEMGRSNFFIARRFEDSVLIVGETDSLVVARYSLTGKMLWESRLHRMSGRTKDVDLEAFLDGNLLTFFSVDRQSEELAIEVLDLGTSKVNFWWSSEYSR